MFVLVKGCLLLYYTNPVKFILSSICILPLPYSLFYSSVELWMNTCLVDEVHMIFVYCLIFTAFKLTLTSRDRDVGLNRQDETEMFRLQDETETRQL